MVGHGSVVPVPRQPSNRGQVQAELSRSGLPAPWPRQPSDSNHTKVILGSRLVLSEYKLWPVRWSQICLVVLSQVGQLKRS